MVTISMNNTGVFTSKEIKKSRSVIQVEMPITNSIMTCNCPICNKELTINYDEFDVENCGHCIGIEEKYSLAVLFFDKVECTIFDFDEIQDAVLRIPTKSDRNKIVKRLNSSDYKEAISAEWEVVISSWLSKLGDFEYEQENSKGRKPDISWESFGKEVRLSADIKTVFDQFDRDYPAFEFCSEARSIMMKYVPSSWACSVRFDSQEKGVPQIFPKSRFPHNLAVIEAEIQKIHDTITGGRVYTFIVEGHSISFFLSETNGPWCFDYKSKYYDAHDKNPLYNGLKEKACQLIKDGDELLGIFLCDGGTNTINSNVNSIYAVKLREILDAFFKEEPHINFVAVFGISKPPISTFKFECYLNPYIEGNFDAQRLTVFLERNAHLFSKHQEHPGHVQQKITHTKKDMRKMFCID